MCIRDSFKGRRRTLTEASRQCGVHPLNKTSNYTSLQKPEIHSYYAPFFSPLPNSHSSPPGIPLLTQSTFSSSPNRSIPNTLTAIHPFNQPTIIHPFHMTKPSQCTLVYSLIYSFLHTTKPPNTCLLYTSDAA